MPPSLCASVLSPESQLPHIEVLLGELFKWGPPNHDPVQAWERWFSGHIQQRKNERIYYTDRPEHIASQGVMKQLMGNNKGIEQLLYKREWQSAYQLTKKSILLVHQNAYAFNDSILEQLKRYYFWSYYMLDSRIPSWLFDELIQIKEENQGRFSLEAATLVFIDINFLLWRGELRLPKGPLKDEKAIQQLQERWSQQILFWANLFVPYVEMRKDLLNEKIRTWLIEVDKPKILVGNSGGKISATYLEAPIPYLFGAFDDIFHQDRLRQPFEDANHRIGAALLNYLLISEIGEVYLNIYGYKPGERNRHLSTTQYSNLKRIHTEDSKGIRIYSNL